VNLSINEATFGRFDDSLLWARRAFVISARNDVAYYHVGVPLRMMRAHEASLRWLTHAERQVPDGHRIQLLLAEGESQFGDNGQALTRLRRAAERWPDDGEVANALAATAFLAHAADAEVLAEKLAKRAPEFYDMVTPRVRWAYFLKRRGDRRAEAEAAEALRLSSHKLASGSQDPWLSINLAAASLIQGDREAAFSSLTRGVENGFREYDFMALNPIFEPITGDARLRALVAKMTEDLALQRRRAAEQGLLDLESLIPGLK